MRVDHFIHIDTEVATLLRGIRHDLGAIQKQGIQLMADSASVLAQVTANTDVLRGVAIIADDLNEGQTTIEGLIADLKAQIAGGGTPTDFAPLEAALTDQAAVIDGMSKAIAAPKPPVVV